MRRELAEYERPQVRLAPLFGRTPKDGLHVNRSLVQVNFFPRQRP